MKRERYLDIARALAIIFIVVGHTLVHSEHCYYIFKMLYGFHVALFFVISGYSFKVDNLSFWAFLKKKFLRIMLPYFIWAFLFLIPYFAFGSGVGESVGVSSSFNLKEMLLNVLYGNGNMEALKQNSSLWFLPALFSMEIIYYFVIKIIGLFKRNGATKFILFIPIIAVAFLAAYCLKIQLPWGINTALVMGIFFYFGWILKSIDYADKKIFTNPLFMVSMFAFGAASILANSLVMCIDYVYGNLVLCILSGITMALGVFAISVKVKSCAWLEYIGRNTMGILIFHKLIIVLFQTKMGRISDLLMSSNIVTEILISLLAVAISIALSLIVNLLLKKILPFTIGEKYKRAV